jgi:eukaryotic-like serine/threonine-protein kinase
MSTEYQHFGKYELHKRLSRNASGEFWKGYDPELQRTVAIKVYYIHQHVDSDFIAQYAQRMGKLTSLHHSNIIAVQDFYIVPSKNPDESASSMACIITDYIEAQTLADYIRATPGLGKHPPGADILQLFTSLSMAIDYAHQNGIVHGNIKPSNIFLAKCATSQNKIGEPLLTDFEWSSLLRNSNSSNVPLYLAPEQIRGYPANERSDVYSLGVILYELCTGVMPFRGNRPVAIMMQHINALPTPPALLNPTISPSLTNVVMRSLAKDPEIRFASASSMTVAMAKALNMPVPENLSHSAYLLDMLSDSDTTRPHKAAVLPGTKYPIHLTSQFDRSTLSQNEWPWSDVSIVETSNSAQSPFRSGSARERLPSTPTRPTPTTPVPLTEPFSSMNRRSSFYKAGIIVLLILILLASLGIAGFLFLHLHNNAPVAGALAINSVFFINGI